MDLIKDFVFDHLRHKTVEHFHSCFAPKGKRELKQSKCRHKITSRMTKCFNPDIYMTMTLCPEVANFIIEKVKKMKVILFQFWLSKIVHWTHITYNYKRCRSIPINLRFKWWWLPVQQVINLKDWLPKKFIPQTVNTTRNSLVHMRYIDCNLKVWEKKNGCHGNGSQTEIEYTSQSIKNVHS